MAGSDRRRAGPRERALTPSRHAVYRLDADLLLVFKPRGHREAPHAHPHRQRLCVLRGRLAVCTGTRTVRLSPRSRPLILAAGRAHRTVALEDTWVLAEAVRAAG